MKRTGKKIGRTEIKIYSHTKKERKWKLYPHTLWKYGRKKIADEKKKNVVNTWAFFSGKDEWSLIYCWHAILFYYK